MFFGLSASPKASLVKGRWVALKRRPGGIPHAATPLFRKAFGEFVLPARIPPDRLKGDPTPFNKGVYGSGKQFGKFLFAFLCAGRPFSNDHFSSAFVLIRRGLHNYIMVNLLFRCRCIACRRCHGRLVIAPTTL